MFMLNTKKRPAKVQFFCRAVRTNHKLNNYLMLDTCQFQPVKAFQSAAFLIKNIVYNNLAICTDLTKTAARVFLVGMGWSLLLLGVTFPLVCAGTSRCKTNGDNLTHTHAILNRKDERLPKP